MECRRSIVPADLTRDTTPPLSVFTIDMGPPNIDLGPCHSSDHAIPKWIRPCEQAAVEVHSVPALPVVALLEETASTDAELETVAMAMTVDALTPTATISTVAEEAEEPKQPKKKASSFLELLAQEDAVRSRTSSVGSIAMIDASSAKVAACLCSSPTGLTKKVAGVKRGIGRGISSIGKGHSLSTADHLTLKPTDFTALMAAEKKSVKSGIDKGLFCSGKDWSMEVKGFGKAEQGQTVSNLLYGCNDEEEEEDGSSRERSKISGTRTMCYMD
ncbi:unnamed protein product [Closterium sp. Yama58-4]|nr:unnamed protein product [Closterium sp. Yama58-4]